MAYHKPQKINEATQTEDDFSPATDIAQLRMWAKGTKGE